MNPFQKMFQALTRWPWWKRCPPTPPEELQLLERLYQIQNSTKQASRLLTRIYLQPDQKSEVPNANSFRQAARHLVRVVAHKTVRLPWLRLKLRLCRHLLFLCLQRILRQSRKKPSKP